MSRHKKSNKSLNQRHFETTHFQNVPPSNNDIWIIAKKYDRLDLLAYRYYGDRNLWWIIAISNKLVNGSLVVPAGQRIRIPKNENPFLEAIDKSTFDIESGHLGGLPDGLGGGEY